MDEKKLLQIKFTQALLYTNCYKINPDFYNEIIDNALFKIKKHFNYLINTELQKTFSFNINFNLEFVIKNNEVYIKISDVNDIIKEFHLMSKNTLYMFEGDDSYITENIKKIKSPIELEKQYPEIYKQYVYITNDKKYTDNFASFIIDYCDAYETIKSNYKKIEELINNNLYPLSKLSVDECYNLFLLVLFEHYTLNCNGNNGKLIKDDLITNIFMKTFMFYEKSIGIIHESNIMLYNHLRKQIKIDYNYNNYIEFAFNQTATPTLESNDDGKYRVHYHNKKYSYPLLYNSYICDEIKIVHQEKYGPNFFLEVFIKYSGVFEYCFDSYNDTPRIGIKHQFDNMLLEDVVDIAISNLKSLKEKKIKYICRETKYINEPEIVKFINSYDDNLRQIIIQAFIYLTESAKFSENIPSINQLAHKYYELLNSYDSCNDIVSLFTKYIEYIIEAVVIGDPHIIFVDKSCLKKEDIDDLTNIVMQKIVFFIGGEKYDYIIDRIDNCKGNEDIYSIISECLTQKKNIDDEIREVQRHKENTPKTDPQYRILKQRLEKLLSYKNHFQSEEVISGEGTIFDDYYGFEYKGLYVFDFFCDLEDENILRKAKQEYGHRVYILTEEDYLKVKGINKRSELYKYIRDNLEPCAGSMYHSDNFENKLLSKVKSINECIEKRDFILNLAKTDNPVTDEEIFLTQEEFAYYVSKFISSDTKVIEDLKKKSKLFQTKEAKEREKTIKVVSKIKSEHPPKEDLTESEKTELNLEMDEVIDILDKINIDRIKNNLEPLSFENANFFDVYKAVIDYQEKHNVKIKLKRDPLVALETKKRTFYNDEYHCELCGCSSCDLLYFDSHHFIPISEGGPDEIYNTVCLCQNCHRDIHNNRVGDIQYYSLIKSIKNNIIKNTPELLTEFETLLGPVDNYYLIKLKDYDTEMDKELDKAMDNNASQVELDKLLNALLRQKEELYKKANRLQDYYRYADSYKEEEKRRK